MNTDEDGWTDVAPFAVLGDWDVLWAAAREDGAKAMVVEHDNPKDPAGFATRSHAFLSPERSPGGFREAADACMPRTLVVTKTLKGGIENE